MTELGKQVRLNRLFSDPSGRLCSVAVDHFIGYQDGLPEGLRNLPAAIEAVVAGRPDAVTMHKGVAVSCWGRFAGQVPLIMQSVAGRPDDSADECITRPEDAVRIGADAYAHCVFVCGPTEGAHLHRASQMIQEAEAVSMPVIVHTYPRRYSPDGTVAISHEPEHIAWAVRCAIELGADVIKTPYTGDPDSFGQIVRDSPIPVVAAGGPRAETLDEALEMAAGVVASGAQGITVGRNVWGFDDITAAVKAFKAVVHEAKSVPEALAAAGLR